MKKFSYISGILGLNLAFGGSAIKVLHWPGANIILLSGIAIISLVFMPTVVILLLKETTDKLLRKVYIFGFISFAINLVGIWFKVSHWPASNILLVMGLMLPFVLFLPLYIYYHNVRKLQTNLNFFAIMIFMVYLGVFSTLLVQNNQPVPCEHHLATHQ